MDIQAIRAQMPVLVAGHIPLNVRTFKFNIFDGQPKVSAWGFHIDPKPFAGKVIADTGDAIVVKIGRAEFAVLDRALLSEVPDEGTKVQVEPYARRRFDGLRADTPEERTEHTADGTPYTVQTHILGSAPASRNASSGIHASKSPLRHGRTGAASKKFFWLSPKTMWSTHANEFFSVPLLGLRLSCIRRRSTMKRMYCLTSSGAVPSDHPGNDRSMKRSSRAPPSRLCGNRMDRVGGGVTPAVLPHHRTYGSVYGGSCLLTNCISELGSVDVSPVVSKRPDRPLEFPTPTS